MTTAYTPTTSEKKKKGDCGCGGSSSSSSSDCGCGGSTSDCGCGCGCSCESCGPCCTNVCFERPNYFCGHLLTDDDLNSEQRYFREKNKLYHRTLDGHGIVCGLRVTRDLECPGYVSVGNGFAIDDCGNDLVVCEPTRFNVIRALREKGFLVQEVEDPCAGKDDDDDCHTTQCFYLAACYDEQKSGYESPLQSACSPGPTACEATRTQEGVKLQILDKLPHEKSALEWLQETFECCLSVLNEGTFGSTLRFNANAIADLFDAKAVVSTDYFNIFCQLKVYFLQRLRKCPDLYDACLESDVSVIVCPQNPAGQIIDWQPTEDAFCKFFNCVLRYINDCILGELIFQCPAPRKTGEVVLATLEIKNGKLAHICYCSRSYVWAPANFIKVLITTTIERAACHPPAVNNRLGNIRDNANAPANNDDATRVPPKKATCCPEPVINCRNFVALYQASPDAYHAQATSSLKLVQSLTEGFSTVLNFFDPNALSMHVFDGMDQKAATALAQKLNIDLQVATEAPPPTPLSPLRDAFVNVLAKPGDRINAALVNGKVQVNTIEVTPSSAVFTGNSGASSTEFSAALAERDKTITALRSSIDDLSARLEKLEPSKGGGKKGGN